jgi:integrase
MADKLTARRCVTAPDGKYSDGDGLRLIVRGDTRAWTMQYTFNGRRREKGLGKLEQVSLEKARKLAARVRDQVLLGVDPLEAEAKAAKEAAEAKAAQKAAVNAEQATLRRVVREYHEKNVEPVRTDKHGKQWLASIENHVPKSLLDKPIAEVALDPAKWIDALRPLYVNVRVTGRRVRQRLDAAFDYAVLRGVAPSNPMKVIVRELQAVESKKKSAGFRALDYREVPALFKRLDSVEGTGARALQFAMLTAARTAEALGMRWSELSADGKTWVVPGKRMKGGEAHTVYLSAQAQAILQRQRGKDDTFVFPSPVAKDQPLSNMGMLMTLRRLGVNGATTVHGVCRASFSSWSNETGAARPDVIECALAHREQDRVRRSYNRAQFLTERAALLAKWANYLSPPAKKTRVKKPKRSANVIPIRGKARAP